MEISEKLNMIKNQGSLVVMGFPGSGKTHFFKEALVSNLRVVDCDMVMDPKDKQGSDYVKLTLDAMKNGVDVMLLISHPWIRKALEEANIMYVLSYPNHGDKNEYMRRYRERGSSDEFITRLDENWDKWIDSCVEETFPIRIASPGPDWTITDTVKEMVSAIDLIKEES